MCVCVWGGGGGGRVVDVQPDDKYLSLSSLFSSLGIFHCVFGDLQESLVSACREALDTTAQEKDKTIVFWMNGFAAVSSEWRVIILEIVGE